MASCASKTRLRKRPEDTCVSDVDSDPPPKKASVYDSSSLVSNADKKTSHASSSGARRLNDHPRGTGEGAVDEAPVYVHRILGSRRGYDKTRPPPASSSCESEGRIRAEAGGETRRSSRVGQVLELLSASGNGEQAASPGETTAPSSPHSIRVTASIDVAEQKGTVASNLSGKDSESESPQGESACSSCLNHRTSACSVSGHSPRQRSPAVRPGAAPSAVRPASRAPSSSIGSSPSASLARPPDGAKSLRQSLQAEDSSPTANAGRSCSSSASSSLDAAVVASPALSSAGAGPASESSSTPSSRSPSLPPSSPEGPELPSWIKQLNSPMLPSILSAVPRAAAARTRLTTAPGDSEDRSAPPPEETPQELETVEPCYRARTAPVDPPPPFPFPLSVTPSGSRGRSAASQFALPARSKAAPSANGASSSEHAEKRKSSQASDLPSHASVASTGVARGRTAQPAGAGPAKGEKSGVAARHEGVSAAREEGAAFSSQTLKRLGEDRGAAAVAGGAAQAGSSGTAGARVVASRGSSSASPGTQSSGGHARGDGVSGASSQGSSDDAPTSPRAGCGTGASQTAETVSFSSPRSASLHPSPLPRALPRRGGTVGVGTLSVQRGGIGGVPALSEHPSFSLEKQLQGAEDRRAYLRRLLRGGAPGRPEWPLPVETKTLLEAAGVTAGRFQPDRWFGWGIEPFPSARVLEWKLARVLGRPVLDAAARGDATVWGVLCLSLGAILLGADVAELRAGFQRQGLPVPDPLVEGRAWLRGAEGGK
ncbi:conserved hypothetical protein [Neospora caninum Liverpool]|uniref:Uncharacterized protein n=1 Tax=Neospora caninum (strain Liverpool) TaxID=572307 RepID=F0VM38_NEOCL|nr:conserved hypothetical protein [Neospora caninum Liverpool]CBZ54316.1 conserved hypothetical protein [Neospora caninum Liverpool]CEL69022.1 TPA: hypothetical protein BN1204_047470 [Neospora caninum Liverpool]|eukprot:XP_003884347.1 conserved hypothetical protein [Neospora caninum Liverpool]